MLGRCWGSAKKGLGKCLGGAGEVLGRCWGGVGEVFVHILMELYMQNSGWEKFEGLARHKIHFKS